MINAEKSDYLSISNNNYLNSKTKIKPPDKLNINVMTIQSKINTELDIPTLVNKIIIDDINIVGVLYNPKNNNSIYMRGYSPSYELNKSFPHQLTAFVCPNQNNLTHLVNTKIFRNGSIQMTGCKNEEEGHIVTEIMINSLIKIQNEDCIKNKNKLERTDLYISMINGICKVYFNIKLEALVPILSERYKLKVILDKGVHPPAKIWFMWNSLKKVQDGICTCEQTCEYTKKKKDFTKKDMCKKITVSIQHTGVIQFMGGNEIKQLSDSYDFIINFLMKHYSDIIRY